MLCKTPMLRFRVPPWAVGCLPGTAVEPGLGWSCEPLEVLTDTPSAGSLKESLEHVDALGLLTHLHQHTYSQGWSTERTQSLSPRSLS